MLSYIIIGIVLGATYGLIAVGLIFVFQTTRVLNFAFGAFGMIACFIFDTLQSSMSPWLAFAITAGIALVAGVVLGLVTLGFQEIDVIIKATATLGLLTALQGVVFVAWGTGTRLTPSLTQALAFRAADVGVTWQQVVIVIVDLALTALIIVFFKRGRVGAALRAVADDPDVSRLVGLPIRSLWILAWASSTVLAAVVMVLVLPYIGLDATNLSFIVLVPIVAIVVARFRSVAVGFATAFIIGLVQAIFGGYSQLTSYQDVLPLGIILLASIFGRTTPAFERV